MAFIDQTGDFRKLIAEGSGGPSKRPKPPRRKSDEEKKDSFLKEAYQIVSCFSLHSAPGALPSFFPSFSLA